LTANGIRPTILVPGFIGGKLSFRPFRDYLRQRGIDAHSWSQAPFLYRRPLERYAARLADHIVARDMTDLTLVGWSMGGFVSAVAALYPDVARRVRRVITFGTPWDGTWAARVGLVTDRMLGLNVRQMRPGSSTVIELVELLHFEERPWDFWAVNGWQDALARAPQKNLKAEWCRTGAWNHRSLLWHPDLFDLIHKLIILP
jgi:pimeloyl-ACP methyl ester carboxylesterase